MERLTRRATDLRKHLTLAPPARDVSEPAPVAPTGTGAPTWSALMVTVWIFFGAAAAWAGGAAGAGAG